MCGITGIFDTRGKRPIDRSVLHRMNESQHHRGPDEGGLHVEPGVGLGHRRLSIIDLSTGQQPLYNEDGSVAVVYNGEIYNYKALIPELQALGHVFRTKSDTEVIVHAWEAWGEACVTRFRGMFAFALWDRGRDTLFLARDRLGVKPLYYCILPDKRIVFGSELKALLVHPEVPRRIDPHAVEEYFTFGYVPDPKSIYRDIKKLEPGYYLSIRRGSTNFEPVRYWDVPLFGQRNPGDPNQWEHELRERLQESVRKRLVSDVPLGAFLSGGIDSSAVVAMMREIGASKILTCSIGFKEARYDESKYAQLVATQKQTDHKAETVEASDYGLLDQLVDIYDEPYADSSAIPTYRVCQLARRHVTVALSGDGGDEDFIGYRRYKLFAMEERFRSRLPAGLRQHVFGALGRWYPKLDWAPRVLRGKTTFQGLARGTVDAYLHGVSHATEEMRNLLFNASFKRELQGYSAREVFHGYVRDKTFEDPLALVQYLDYKTYLPGDILTKVDRASMAHSLEVRTPFLDYEFVEWASQLPSSIKLKGSEGKHVLKKALEPLLPREVLYRSKMGFAVPIDMWFRGSLRNHLADVVKGERLAQCGVFDRARLRQIVDDHQSGRRDYSATLWSLLMFDGFLQKHGAAVSTPTNFERQAGAA
jgi:asparagine synthase (glutamine-hydrolysing)